MSNNKYTFFWGGPLSQWHPCSFILNDFQFNCAEQYMMFAKAQLFGDVETRNKIMKATHPKEQKQLGRTVKSFKKDEWDAVAKKVVYEGNVAKFGQNPELKKYLLSTAPTLLVEASPYDCIWGIGIGVNDSRRFDESKWRGTNWLGQVLTNLRAEFLSG